MKPIRTLLVANRGEIARRIMRSAYAMGIRCVAVYEDEDRDSLYVAEADAAHFLPNGFLDGARLLEVCRLENVDAIHPGYGFLSENSAFVRSVETAGIVFVGPSAAAMERMGEKTAARIEARAAKVPLLPGVEIDDATALNADAQKKLVGEIGLPLVLKAAAGGGGKAQAIVNDETEIAAAFEKVIREAERLYHSKSLVVERYLERARHVEVQIIGNAAGKNFALFDRDCSAQRNNQKIIEEAPAPHLDDNVRAELHASAVRLADHVGYRNAGTMEYLYDTARGEFYFLEMNTRLQVEHTVTEAITGLDLVREQLLIAQGATTDYGSLKASGHAIEARICAEKSDGTYQPSTGTILEYIEPDGVRIDTGVQKGSTISGKYDNMIAKVIVHAATRDAAIAHMKEKLSDFIVNGIHTNIPLLVKLLDDAAFRAVTHYTRYLQREFSAPVSDAGAAAAVASAILYELEKNLSRENYGKLSGFSNVR
ncbi:MAG: ATP-grasp domain-containing protein [Spirochaetes bacterium]|nr:ATP-grasp domain-containing protein [Spirochaetota bacterium]